MGEQELKEELKEDGTPKKPVVEPGAGSNAGGVAGAAGLDQETIESLKGLKTLPAIVAALTERLTATQRTVDTLIQTPARKPGAGEEYEIGAGAPGGEGEEGDYDFIEKPKESIAKLEGRIISRLRQTNAIQKAADEAMVSWYEENKDLKGAEVIVEGVAIKLGQEMPSLQGKAYGDELAKRARAELARIQKPAEPGAVLHIEPGKGVDGKPIKEEKPKSSEEETADYVKERRTRKKPT